jgi:RNA polymerase sigma factor (sigma-70 family)
MTFFESSDGDNLGDSFDEFTDHLRQLRMLNPETVDDFWKRYEPYIRRTLRFRIARASLQQAADSVDVCQSVFGSLLLRLNAGEYELASEDDLRKLLVAIANNKFLMLVRRESASKRSRRNTKSIASSPEPVCGHSEDPGARMMHEELVNEVSRRMSSQELELFRMRQEGISWEEIGEILKEDSRVLCKRYSRALKRVEVEMGLEDDE